MEKPEKSHNAPKDGKEKISTKDLFGFLAWYEDPATSLREKKLLKKTIDAAIDERREVVEKEFEKMVDEDPNFRAASESLSAEMTAGTPQSKVAELAAEFQKSPGLFENYIRWLDDVASAIGGKKHPKEILNMLYSLRLAERNKSLNAKDILAMQVFCIRQIKKNLREHGIAGDILTREAFQKWSRSKKIPGTGDR